MARTISASVAAASTLFLGALGAPTSPNMVRAVSAWLYQESGGRIIGNNPWNLHSWGGLPGQTGYRYAGPGDRNVAVFRTLADGTTASARRLITLSGSYGYGAVVAAARSGSAVDFLDALARSSWSAGHYGGPGPNSSVRRLYVSLGGVADSKGGATSGTTTGGTSGGSFAGTDLLHTFVRSIGRTVNDPIRAEDVKPFLVFLQQKGLLPGGPGDVDFEVLGPVQAARDTMNRAVGKPWTVVSSAFFEAAKQAGDPIGNAANALGATLGAALEDAAVGLVINVAILGSIVTLTYLGLRSILAAPARIGAA